MASKTLNQWWLRRGEGGRFHSIQKIDTLQQVDINSYYWREQARIAKETAIAILGGEEFCRRMEILWPGEENKTWKETALINREIVNGEQWK